MIRQAFTEENLRRIYDFENRKGVNLAKRFFPQLQAEMDTLKQVSAAFRQLESKKGTISPDQYLQSKEELNQDKLKALEKKEEKLSKVLAEISGLILHDNYNIILRRLPLPTGRIAYGPPKNCAISYFAIKQVQYNIHRVYKVKQQNRHHVIPQLSSLLEDCLPKWIIRLDIKSFYESIPHNRLLKKLNDDAMLSYTSRRVIQQILREYKKISQSSIGLPRGIGVSAYLSELYMRKFDNKISQWGGVFYYARYVDDIVIVLSPQYGSDISSVQARVKGELEKLDLSLNTSKLALHDLSNPKNVTLEYLGYEITFGTGGVTLGMSSKKLKKYKQRISLAFADYERNYSNDLSRASKTLYSRLKFLTGNTQLYSNKKHILTGIYFSNKHLTDFKDLTALDCYLMHKLKTPSKVSAHLGLKILQLSFLSGFKNKCFYIFSINELEKITKVWKNVA